MARPNYNGKKRQRELTKQKRREEKELRKQERKRLAAMGESAPPSEGFDFDEI